MVSNGGGPNDPRSGVRGSRFRLLGPRGGKGASKTAVPVSAVPTRAAGAAPSIPKSSKTSKKRVLFVCIGNAYRSQLAEAFARAYGADVIDAHSAGLTPAMEVAPLTKQILVERNLGADDLFPKGMDLAAKEHYQILVNMTGKAISLPGARVLHWQVEDPVGKSEEQFRAIAAQVERLVQRLVLELRQGS